jgi:hypothetical protein
MIPPSKAARILGVHVSAVHVYCQKAVRGDASPLTAVLRNEKTGYYWVSLAEVNRLAQEKK